MSENCFICDRALSLEACTTVRERGIETFIKLSKLNKDDKHLLFQHLKQVTVHERCRKVYSKQKKTQGQSTSSRAQRVSEFDFKNKCVICGGDASQEFIDRECKKPKNRREEVSCVTTIQFKDSLVRAAEVRQDEQVLRRISLEHDLVAAEARYHASCGKTFLKKRSTTTDYPRGRPEDDDVSQAFDYVCKYIEDNEDQCQFTLTEIFKNFQGYIPTYAALKTRLIRKYGEDIILTSGGGTKQGVICFRNTGYKIITDSWYQAKESNEKKERRRIVQAAAAIIREDIRSVIYTTDTYPKVDEFLKDIEKDIPETLGVLLNGIINPKPKNPEPKLHVKGTKKVIAIAHSIIHATRPRSFISPLLLTVGVTFHKKYGSKDLVEMLSSLGFSCSYKEVRLFQSSSIQEAPKVVLQDSFSQFVFDNADVNVDTLDGANTFHAVGGLQCITPVTSARSEARIARLQNVPTAKDIAASGTIPLTTFQKTSDGLESIALIDINEKSPVRAVRISPTDFLWIFGKWKEHLNILGWNGFMETVTSHRSYQRSRTLILPFLNAPPANMDTLYSVLLNAVERLGNNQKGCFVTFDQPLYYKAREIVASSGRDSPLSSVIVRLGGFHLLMSFLGAIGYIMDGSGLQDVLSTIYARASTEKILTGHAYSRAVRGHILLHLTLAKLVLNMLHVSDDQKQSVLNVLNGVGSPLFPEQLDKSLLNDVMDSFYEKLCELELRGPTAKLWVQYFHLVTIVKRFIEAERSGDWFLHLHTVQQMLPYLHASGHFLYAKSCQLYLQDMLNLNKVLPPDEYDRFVNQSFFTIRRSDKFWSGVWTDQTIEQVVMRSMKSQGGLSHGRGITDSNLVTWVATIPTVMELTLQLEEFCGVEYNTTEQHVDARMTRVRRDEADVALLLQWFLAHDPFPNGQFIMSISTGVIGDKTINCHDAFEKGTASLTTITNRPGINFKNVKFQRKNRVIPLKVVNSKITVHDKVVPVSPDTIFRRIHFLKKSDKEIESYFQYELAPYPLSLFDETGMRKTRKSVLYDLFEPVIPEPNLTESAIVIDGGWLLHRVVWQSKEIFSTILSKYIDYVTKYYSCEKATIVFDGYPEEAAMRNTKSAERFRRSGKHSSATVLFSETMTATMPKEQFLSNDSNKKRLISILVDKLEQVGYRVMQATEDADTLIVNTAIQMTEMFSTVVIIGEDTDLLVLLTAKAPSGSKIYLMKPGKGTSPNTFYSPDNFKFSPTVKNNLLFLHAISGCDTTSAFYRQGKIKFVKLLDNSKEIQEAVQVFYQPDADPKELFVAGRLLLVALYTTKVGQTSLDEIRYSQYARSLANPGFNLASLPPTNAAADQHLLRVYHQLQTWNGTSLDALRWGWKSSCFGLLPIPTTKDPAPHDVLNAVSCKCTKGCAGKCTCRKVGIKCSTICINCQGNSCTNSPLADDEGVSTNTFTNDDDDTPPTEEFDDTEMEIIHRPEDFLEEGPPRAKQPRLSPAMPEEGPSNSS